MGGAHSYGPASLVLGIRREPSSHLSNVAFVVSLALGFREPLGRRRLVDMPLQDLGERLVVE